MNMRLQDPEHEIMEILKDRQGAVLVLVLIVLVAAIIIGVMMMRSSSLEARMAGNERRYILDFANLESAVNLALIQSTSALMSVMDSTGTSYDYPEGSMPQGVNVKTTLARIGKPPVGSGTDASFRTRYYVIEASDEENNQVIDVGAYKVFPQGTEQ
jgi:hypothetical protein